MSYQQRGDPGPIPNRWLHCPRKSESLIVDRIIALKTPLSNRYDDQVPAAFRFTPKMFFDSCKSKRVKVGFWIDLTNTQRFYNRQEIEEYGVKYIKMQCRGHGETPNKEQTKMFIELVDNIMRSNPLDCIAVHCTHGFNRTGFLIISYLIEKMDFDLETAMQTFASARPVGIYKADYIEELYTRYEPGDDVPPPPMMPDWCSETDDSDRNHSNNAQGASTSSKNSSSFMEGVPGVYEYNEQPKTFNLQRKIQKMCGWNKKSFPGSQPVSMSVHNLQFLHERPYRVSWKADGTRYMMLIDGENEVYFFDRDNKVYKVEKLRFVHRKNLNLHLKNTLLDGEMVIDKVGNENIPRYLAYDIVTFEGENVGDKSFYPLRMQYLDYEIIKPRYVAMEKGLINKIEEPFSVRKKEFWPVVQAGSLLSEKFARSLSHEPDGLIFQPSLEGYVAGRCDEVLKWKPPTLNSIDFRLKIVQEGGMGMIPKKKAQLYVGQQQHPFSSMKYTKELKDLDNKIVECKLENQSWKFMRVRTDKSFPNSKETAEAVLDTIQNPVTKEYLLEFIRVHRFDVDTEMMPPPKRKRH